MHTNETVEQVLAARKDPSLSDEFIRQYMPFIKAETTKFTKRPVTEDGEDELSIAMFAFYEAMTSYEEQKGAFFPYASLAIRHRLIDYYRKEKRNEGHISLDAPTGEDEDGTLADTLKSDTNVEKQVSEQSAAREEIELFIKDLETFGLTLTDIADNCPKQKRTFRICRETLAYARQNPEILTEMVETKKLPIGKLARGYGSVKKKLERHRKYMIAILLAYTNGFEIIRGHLNQMAPQKGDDTCDT